VEQYVLNEWE